MSLKDIWDIPLSEAVNLIKALQYDSSSWYYAKLNSWDYPMSVSDIIAAKHLNVFIEANSKKKPKKENLWQFPFKSVNEEVYSGKKMNAKDAVKVFNDKYKELGIIK